LQHFCIWHDGTQLFFGIITTFTRGKSGLTLKAGSLDPLSRGTLKICNSYKDNGLPEPDNQEKDGGFTAALHKAFQEAVEDGAL